MANKITLDLKSYTVPDKVQFMRQVVTKLTGNPDFPTPTPAATAISGAATTLENKFNTQQIAEQAAIAATTQLGIAEKAADAVMNSFANYVEEASGGEKAKIEGVGLSMRAPQTPTTSLAAPQNLNVTVGDSDGELDGSWDRVNKAKNYEVQISDDPPTSNSWRAGDIVSASRVTLTGLTSGAKIWVRVRALGPKGLKSPWSDPAVKRVP